MKKSITLVELLISMTLLGVIILGAIAFHLSGERFLSSSEKKTQVLNDLTFVLQHLRKNILLAAGDVNNTGIRFPSLTILRVRQDRNIPRTPAIYTDDTWFEYQFRPNPDHDVIFGVVGSGNWETLSTHYVGDVGFRMDLVDGGARVRNLTMRLDPTSPEDPRTNPKVSTVSTAGGTRTVYFYSLVHSWN